jgi:hypothetical protein
MRYVEIGRTLAYEDVMLKYSLRTGIAFDGSELPMVELTTTIMPKSTMNAFDPCEYNQRYSEFGSGG